MITSEWESSRVYSRTKFGLKSNDMFEHVIMNFPNDKILDIIKFSYCCSINCAISNSNLKLILV